ncbi:RICIN domain-containing protein [Streptomyces brasiliscabiei]|uniref:RICIN domain-containing protein n=1 Tax=Streptomyces brasiliscabiei TaxID=2736302 RepID=UPI0038F80944
MRHTRPKRLSALAAALLAIPIALGAAPTPASAVTGTPATDTTYDYTAQITIGDHDRGCSGVLVARQWLLTAASCFADDPATSISVPAGKPALTTTATIGRADLTSTAGAVREVTELVPRSDRDVVLARLNRPVTNVTPIALATTAPTTGEELKFAGYGRTATEWAPLNLHTGTLSVDASDALTATVTGKDGAAACMGDTGGPVVRTTGGTPLLAALSSRSHQGGCFGIDPAETRTGGIVARVDDLPSWVDEHVKGYRPVTNIGTERCLAVPSSSTDNGTLLIQWTCNKGTEQQWRLEHVAGGNGDRYLVRNNNSRRCLAMPSASTADGTQAIQWTCTGNNDQIWIHDSLGRLRNLNSDKCLAIPSGSTTIGTKVIQWPCGTGTEQRWTW